MAILVFKKKISYDSEERRNSYGMTLISGILVGGTVYEVYVPDGRGTTPNEVAADRFEN
jgi:hypothetical protein